METSNSASPIWRRWPDRPNYDVCSAHGEVLLHAPGRNAERLEVLGRDEEDIALAAAAMGAALDAFVLEAWAVSSSSVCSQALRRGARCPRSRPCAEYKEACRERTWTSHPDSGSGACSIPPGAPRQDWEPHVTSTVVETRGEVALIDPLAPPEEDGEVWERLDATSPTLVVILKPDHVRDVDLFVRRYGARAFGPSPSGATTFPRPSSRRSSPAPSSPGGLVALHDGRGRNETPLWAPERRALVFADALTERGGELRSGARPGTRSGRFRAQGSARPALRARGRVAWRARARPSRIRAGARAPALPGMRRRAGSGSAGFD